MKESCLSLRHVSVSIDGAPLVRDVTFDVPAGEVLGLVGESGSGKSLTLQAVMGLAGMGRNNVQVQGEAWFQGKNLCALKPEELRALRGAAIGMVFQDPLASLNPVLPVGWQVAELFRVHRKLSRREAGVGARQALLRAGVTKPEELYYRFPHQLSGGQRQRVLIAMAVALEPPLIIADEPTTALDVTLQAQIIEELRRLQQEGGSSVLLVSHDMGVIAELADQVAVMREGRVVEQGSCMGIFDAPQEAYTQRLLAASRFELIEEAAHESSCS